MIFFSETTLWIDTDFLCINFTWNMESPSFVIFRSFFFFLLLWKAASLYVPPSSSLSFFPLFFFNPQWHTPTFPLSQSQSSWWCSSVLFLFFFNFIFFFFCSEFCHTLKWKGLRFTCLPQVLIFVHVCGPYKTRSSSKQTHWIVHFFKSPSPQSVSYHKCLMRDVWMKEEKKMKGQRILRVRIWLLLVPCSPDLKRKPEELPLIAPVPGESKTLPDFFHASIRSLHHWGSPGGQRLRLCAPNAGGLDSTPGQAARSHVLHLQVHMLQLRPKPDTHTQRRVTIYWVLWGKEMKTQIQWVARVSLGSWWQPWVERRTHTCWGLIVTAPTCCISQPLYQDSVS